MSSLEEARKQFEEWLTPADLHPDLQPYVYHDPKLGRCLKHPLIIEIFFPEEMNNRANMAYQYKLDWIKDAIENKKWNAYVFLHERPYRPEALARIADQIESNEDYWQLVASVWTDTENLFQWKALIPVLLLSDRPDRHFLMDEDERAQLEAMPEELTVYRGYNSKNRMGWSWTTDRDRAEWFAHRFAADSIPRLAQGIVDKSDVIAFFTSRGENEIVVNPKQVRNLVASPL